MKLRWKVIEDIKPKSIDVKRYREEHCLGLNEAIRKLTVPGSKTLQYSLNEGVDWHNVPIEVIN